MNFLVRVLLVVGIAFSSAAGEKRRVKWGRCGGKGEVGKVKKSEVGKVR